MTFETSSSDPSTDTPADADPDAGPTGTAELGDRDDQEQAEGDDAGGSASS